MSFEGIERDCKPGAEHREDKKPEPDTAKGDNLC
jgi:hypothetical protein